LIRFAVRTRPEHAERVLAELIELAPGGVEEDRGESYVEYAIYGPPGEVPELPDLEAAAGDDLVEITSTEVPDDWADRWQEFHRPIVVGGRLTVRPSWVDADEREAGGSIEIVIDPARAFGTGAHATTRMCLELLLEHADAVGERGAFADWGTGSGVLAIAAAKLGYSPVSACDHEPASLDAARTNAAANGVELDLARINLREQAALSAPTVAANLTAPVLLAVAKRLADRGGDPPDALICSGLLAGEVGPVVAAFGDPGLAVRDCRADGEWRALLFAASS
jgi:ribosomal protein L11 methyltransferase